ncbi:MAG: class II aldolase/adducin family protein [Oscillospiraceae bacterium]|nr:class II aldolase/adducin family protein [Oscillospiraceae bacterium]
MKLFDYKKQVLEYAQKAYRQALVAGTSGNLSARSDEGYIVITPSGRDYLTMVPEDIMVIDLEGKIIEGAHQPSSEWPLHAEIYKSMPEVKSVVHTHSPYATAFAVLNEPIPLVLVEMVYFLKGEIPVAPVAMQGTPDVGLGVVKTLQGQTACLMQNHGAITIGESLPQAFIRTEYLEDAAKIYHMARAVGTPTVMPTAMVQEMLNR